MALGTTLVTPLEMAQAYAALSNGGYRVQAYGVERIRTNGGQVLYQHRGAGQPQVAANPPLSELVGMMRTVVTEGTGARAAVAGYDIAGKTGTTSDFRDAWFCGFSGNFTTVVWMGRDDDAPMRGVTGGSAPAELWHAYMRAALPRAGAQAIPPGPPARRPPPEPIPVSTDAGQRFARPTRGRPSRSRTIQSWLGIRPSYLNPLMPTNAGTQGVSLESPHCTLERCSFASAVFPWVPALSGISAILDQPKVESPSPDTPGIGPISGATQPRRASTENSRARVQ